MLVEDLTRDQLVELKQNMLCQKGSTSWGELAEADSIISDEEVFKEYAGTIFSADDFTCTAS